MRACQVLGCRGLARFVRFSSSLYFRVLIILTLSLFCTSCEQIPVIKTFQGMTAEMF